MRRERIEWPKLVHSVSDFRNSRLLRSSTRDVDFLKWPLVLRVFQHRWLLSRTPAAICFPSSGAPLLDSSEGRGVRFCPAAGAWHWSPAAVAAVLRSRGPAGWGLGWPRSEISDLKHMWCACVGARCGTQ